MTAKLHTAIRSFEKLYILDALRLYEWDKRITAKVLGISVSSLYRKITKYGIKKQRR